MGQYLKDSDAGIKTDQNIAGAYWVLKSDQKLGHTDLDRPRHRGFECQNVRMHTEMRSGRAEIVRGLNLNSILPALCGSDGYLRESHIVWKAVRVGYEWIQLDATENQTEHCRSKGFVVRGHWVMKLPATRKDVRDWGSGDCETGRQGSGAHPEATQHGRRRKSEGGKWEKDVAIEAARPGDPCCQPEFPEILALRFLRRDSTLQLFLYPEFRTMRLRLRPHRSQQGSAYTGLAADAEFS
ncbi:hypothetical protein C8R44DRAFT_938149 [Mycena epipterygia]|nr:hypothetical protein C8R44DRAFT_938149 [Mycena epipterygia]